MYHVNSIACARARTVPDMYVHIWDKVKPRAYLYRRTFLHGDMSYNEGTHIKPGGGIYYITKDKHMFIIYVSGSNM